MLKEIVNTKVPEKTIGEKKLSDKEIYLLKALLNLLLYTGMVKSGEDSLFVSGVSELTPFGTKTPVG